MPSVLCPENLACTRRKETLLLANTLGSVAARCAILHVSDFAISLLFTGARGTSDFHKEFAFR